MQRKSKLSKIFWKISYNNQNNNNILGKKKFPGIHFERSTFKKNISKNSEYKIKICPNPDAR